MNSTIVEMIAKDILERQDKEKALIFTARIGSLLAENDVKVNTSEKSVYEAMYGTGFVKNTEYSVDSLDFTEHDKPYKDEIKELKEHIRKLETELEAKDNLLKIKNGLTGDTEDEPIAVAKNIIDNYPESDVEQIARHLEVYLERVIF